jgi:hypothetical protein
MHHRFRSSIATAALLALAAAAASTARAQDGQFSRDDFSAYRFYVAPGSGNFVMVDGGDVGRDLQPTFGATLGYLHRPFAVDDLDWYIACQRGMVPPEGPCGDPPADTEETDFLAAALPLQLYGSFTFLERVQVGLNLPVLLFADGERYEYIEGTGRNIRSRVASAGGVAGGLLDPRISAKVRILDPDEDGNGVTMAAAAWVSIPLAHYMWELHFLGDPLPQAGGHVIAGFRYEGFRVALNLGGAFREEAINIRSHVGPEAYWGLAAAYRFHPLAEVLVEATGATSFGQRFDSEAPTEIRGAGVLHLGELAVQVGGGAGLVYGVGLPVFHAFAGVRYAPQPDPDTDGDGLTDSVDGCPADAEDTDGFEDGDGCPEADNDGDGLADGEDGCPNEAEDRDSFEDEDGCPDEDNDGDGVRDGYDSCPDTPEDVDGDRDDDGCPDRDPDQDGLEGEADQCPDEAEDFDGFGDEDGCPEEDFDGDGIADERDQCAEEAEDEDGYRDDDGCPEGPGRRGRRGR